MKVNARIQNGEGRHDVTFCTNDNSQSLAILPKPSGFGSSVNGGELLFLALATCYCNDIYREAARRGIKVTNVEVEANGEFDKEGDPAKNVTYKTKVTANANEEEISKLIKQTDRVAEI
jgi:uncharacterized OsmC-like protein